MDDNYMASPPFSYIRTIALGTQKLPVGVQFSLHLVLGSTFLIRSYPCTLQKGSGKRQVFIDPYQRRAAAFT